MYAEILILLTCLLGKCLSLKAEGDKTSIQSVTFKFKNDETKSFRSGKIGKGNIT